jgi:glycosyltransferase involved in cell wall biosynthesis
MEGSKKGIMTKKKLIILHPYITNYGGASKFILEVAERLSKIGWSVLFITIKTDKKIISPYSQVEFLEIGGPTTGSLLYWITFPIFLFRLFKIIDQYQDPILFPQIFPPVWWVGIYKIFRPKSSICWMCHEPSAFIHSPLIIQGLKQPMKGIIQTLNPILKLIDQNIVNKIDFIFVNSKYDGNLVKRVYRRKFDMIVYPGVDSKVFKPSLSKENFLFTVSRFDRQKNIDILIKAFGLLPDNIKNDYRFEIAGEGVERKNLINLVHKLRQTNKIIFLGKISDKELRTKFAKAKIFLFAAAEEPFGIVPVEAMASGTPVIALASGGVKETIINGTTGILVAKDDRRMFANQITRFLENSNLQKQFSVAGRKWTMDIFNWDKTARKFDQFFKSIN